MPKQVTPLEGGLNVSVLGFNRDAIRQARLSLNALETSLPRNSVNLLAREVISRLAERGEAPEGPSKLTAALADLLIGSDDAAPMRLTLKLLSGGMPLQELYTQHFAGAARLLGQRWEHDEISSVQVTIAASRIYLMIRGLGGHMATEPVQERHALLVSVPGERHTLGVTMAADLLRREGWAIDLKIGHDHDELVAELARCDFDILGLSAAARSAVPAAARLIAAVRVMAPHAQILMAGNIIAGDTDLRDVLDVDAAALDFQAAHAALETMARASAHGRT